MAALRLSRRHEHMGASRQSTDLSGDAGGGGGLRGAGAPRTLRKAPADRRPGFSEEVNSVYLQRRIGSCGQTGSIAFPAGDGHASLESKAEAVDDKALSGIHRSSPIREDLQRSVSRCLYIIGLID